MMKILFRMTRMTFAFALVLIMAATGLWATGAEEEAPAAAADTAAKVYVTDPSTGMVVEAPRYGGSLTFSTKVADDNLLVDALGLRRCRLDYRHRQRENSGSLTGPSTGTNTRTLLATWRRRSHCVERWLKAGRFPGDGLTYTFNIRKGVRWHNKAPMNGRELTAKDIEYNFHRNMGMGKVHRALDFPRRPRRSGNCNRSRPPTT